jgi:iron-sulfur cluster repair protein YtfE (RIC family)
MGIEDFPKTKSENKEETPEQEEKVLNPEEIEGLGKDMAQYVEELRRNIEGIERELKIEKDKQKIKELRAALKKWQEEYEGLKDFVDDLEAGDYEKITKKPA